MAASYSEKGGRIAFSASIAINTTLSTLVVSAVAGQQAHSVREECQRHGGGPKDLQRQGQPQDGQALRGHQHH